MKVLNAFGITSSVSHIREHGSWWAKIRKAINEIDVQSFWRVTFDNLDFRMKFAKKISARGGQLKRMLHLLTSQWVKFSKNVYTVSSSNIKDDGNFDKSQDPPLLDKLQKHTPNWTPKVPDTVVYTTVDEAHSGSIQDVGKIFVEIETGPMHRQGRLP